MNSRLATVRFEWLASTARPDAWHLEAKPSNTGAQGMGIHLTLGIPEIAFFVSWRHGVRNSRLHASRNQRLGRLEFFHAKTRAKSGLG